MCKVGYFTQNGIILVISRFGFEGWSWVPIASVPDLCILFTLIYSGFKGNDNTNCRVVFI